MKSLLFAGILTVLLVSCSYQSGVIQKEETGYLKFLVSESSKKLMVRIDSRTPFAVHPSSGKTLFEIPSGQHFLTVTRGDTTIVDRVIFIESQATFEVKIP